MRLSVVRQAGLLLAAAMLSACATSTVRSGTGTAVAPAMTVERFLAAANQNDLDTMAALFGTREGSVTRTWTKQEVDDRMLFFANLLRHTDYSIAGEQLVSGRRDEATQLNVRMVIRGDTLLVPFTMVLTNNRNWLIENIGVETVTRGGIRSGGLD